MGDAMDKKRSATLSCLAIVGALAGCASDPAETVAEDAESEAPAFHFASGTLELGEFDPTTLGDDLFDPCTEISAEEFAAAGMTGVEPLKGGNAAENGAKGCMANPVLPGTFRTVIANPASEAVLSKEENRRVSSDYDSAVPGLYVHWVENDGGKSCFAQVDTVRGGIVVSVSINSRRKTNDDPCALATESLEALYQAAN